MHFVPYKRTGRPFLDLLRWIHYKVRLDIRGYVLIPILFYLLIQVFTLCGSATSLDFSAQQTSPYGAVGNQAASLGASFLRCIAGILFFVVLFVGIQLFRYSHRMRHLRTSQGSAHFADIREAGEADLLMPLLAATGPHGRLLLGVLAEAPYLVGLSVKHQESHILATAPTGAGKTSTFIIPALLSETGTRSMYINDVKGELIQQCAGHLARNHKVCIFAPTRPDISLCYNPLAYIENMEDAEALARCWVENSRDTGQRNEFWDDSARMLLTAAILHLKETEKNPPLFRLAELFMRQKFDDLAAIFETSPSMQARAIAGSVFANLGKNERLAGSIMVGMATRLYILYNEELAQVTAKNEIDFRDMLSGPTAFFVSIPASEAQRLRPISAAYVMQLMRFLQRSRVERERNNISFAFYLDEFSNTGRIPNFGKYISLVRSDRIAFILVIQNFEQLIDTYGEEEAKSIRANCNTQIIFPAMGKGETEYYSELLGKTTVFTWSYNESMGLLEGAKHQDHERPLMAPDELRTMPLGSLIVIHGNIPPIRLTTAPYFKLPWLCQRITPYVLALRANQQRTLTATQLWALPKPTNSNFPAPPLALFDPAAAAAANQPPTATSAGQQPPAPPIALPPSTTGAQPVTPAPAPPSQTGQTGAQPVPPAPPGQTGIPRPPAQPIPPGP
jgi:type IV secretion system protein VirD4